VKKLIFLLLFFAVVFVGTVSADTAHPPGLTNLEAALSGDDIDDYFVIPDTVPVVVSLSAERQAGIDRRDKYEGLTILWDEQYQEAAFYLLRVT